MLRAAISDYLAAQQIGDVKTPPAELSIIRRLIFQAKELFWFYWNGLKMVRANYHRAKQLRAGVRDHGWTLNRREELFLRRVDSDMLRLIPFIAVLVILEEILPLLVLYAPWLLPSTCILPTQMLRIITKEEQKRRDALLEVARTALQGNPSSGPLSIATLDAPTLKGICQATDLGTVAPAFILRRRLVAHLR
jgi:LETM1 and EF-hand domain-containing protein 1